MIWKNVKIFFFFFIIFIIYSSFSGKDHVDYGQDAFSFVQRAETGVYLPSGFSCSRHIAYTLLTYLA
ncbi:MAG: hypothetical protein KAJ14_10655, partial [Candidatus Omnitrophica bacterium]|nr:hypothetical protein [Candidatus Omnitrophota bacterium]